METKNISKTKDVNYYVYEHYLDNKLFYIGKGSGERCFHYTDRSGLWKKVVNNREDEIIVKIKRIFQNESQALRFEKYRIITMSQKHHLVNMTYNDRPEKYKEYEMKSRELWNNNRKSLSQKLDVTKKEIKVFDYLNYPNIKICSTVSEHTIDNIAQIRIHLQAVKKSFAIRGYKGLAFSKSISSQEQIAKMATEEGFVPISFWGVNDKKNKMSEEQIEVRDTVIRTRLIPEPYNLVIVNASTQEEWCLDDNLIKLIIINAANESEKIKLLNATRKDISILICSRIYKEVDS